MYTIEAFCTAAAHRQPVFGKFMIGDEVDTFRSGLGLMSSSRNAAYGRCFQHRQTSPPQTHAGLHLQRLLGPGILIHKPG